MPSVRPLASVPDVVQRRTRWTDAELLAADFPEPRWAVPGLVAEGLNLLAGSPKLGKSWLSLGLAAAIATGDAALDEIEVEQGPVLYAHSKTTPDAYKAAAAMVPADGRPAPLLTLETAAHLTTTARPAQRMARSQPARPTRHRRLLRKIRPAAPGGTYAYTADYAAADRFKRLADQYSVPFLVVHHYANKAHEDFQRWSADQRIHRRSRRHPDREAGEDRPRPSFTSPAATSKRPTTPCASTPEPAPGPSWTAPASDHLMHDTRALITRHVRDHPGATPKAIAEATGINANTVRKTCTRMVEDTQLRAGQAGAYYPLAEISDSRDTPPVSQLSLRHSTPPDQQKHQ